VTTFNPQKGNPSRRSYRTCWVGDYVIGRLIGVFDREIVAPEQRLALSQAVCYNFSKVVGAKGRFADPLGPTNG